MYVLSQPFIFIIASIMCVLNVRPSRCPQCEIIKCVLIISAPLLVFFMNKTVGTLLTTLTTEILLHVHYIASSNSLKVGLVQ